MNKTLKQDNKTLKQDNECAYVPVTDIYETSNEYVLKMEMPGVSKQALEITLSDTDLEVKGKADLKEPEEKELSYSECSMHDYYRKFKIGSDINRESINATLENGILTLTLQKKEEVKPRKIEVKVN